MAGAQTAPMAGARLLDMVTSRQIKAMARYHLGIARHLFIHIPKNGGLTIRDSRLMRRKVIFADPYFHVSRDYTRALSTVMAESGHHHGAQHARLIDIDPLVRARVQPVAVVRNPFSRVFSRFTYGERMKIRKGEAPDYSVTAFERFLEERHDYADRPFFWHRAIKGWYPQADYVRDESGVLACHILRLEHLSEDVTRYFGVPDLPRVNQTTAAAPRYTDVYTERHRQIVADHYAADIALFGFDFIGPAQRNFFFANELTQK